MDGLLNVNGITERISFYENLSRVLIILAIVFAILSIVLWFVLKIGRSIRVLSGMGVDKEIRKISKDTQLGKSYSKQSHSKAALSWTTSDISKNNSSFEDTQILDENETVLLTLDEAQSLDEEATVLLSEDETQLLAQNALFEIEEEIVITSNQSKGI